MFVELIKMLALFLALMLVLTVLFRTIGRETPIGKFAIGLLFAAVTIVGMMAPVNLAPGVIIDARTLATSLAGYFFGPLTALTVVVPSVAYRIYLGGAGLAAGIWLIVVSGAMGVAFYYLRRRIGYQIAPLQLLMFGMATQWVALAAVLFLPSDLVWQVFKQVYLVFLVLYPLVTVALGLLIQYIVKLYELERDLYISEQRFRTLVEAMPDLVWLKDPNGNYLSCNKRVESMLGASREQIIGCKDVDFLDEEQARHHREHARESLSRGGGATREDWVTFASDGHQELLQRIKTPVYDADGKLVGILGIARDITEQRKSEQALLKERDLAANIIEGTNAGTWDWDIVSAELTVNEVWAGFFGYTLEELVSLDVGFWRRRIHPEDYELVQAKLKSHFTGRLDYFDMDIRLAHKDHRWVWVNVRGKVVEWSALGRAIRMSGTCLDITSRKLAEHNLAMREKLFRNVFDVSPVAASISTIDGGQYIEVNTAYSRTFGWSRRELMRSESETIGLWPDVDQRHAWIDALKRNSFVEDYAVQMKDSSGSIREVLLSACLIEYNDEPCALTMLHDVTEQKQSQQALVESEQRYRTILDSMDAIGEGLMLISESNRIEYMNKTMVEWFGDHTDELTHEAIPSLAEHYHSKDFRRVLQNQETVHFRPQEGDKRVFDVVGTPLKNGDGSFSQLELYRDITKREENERKIRTLSQVVEQSPVSVLITDLDGSITYVNSAFERVSGYTALEVMGENPRMLQSGNTPPFLYKELWKTILSGRTWRGEFQNRRKNGDIYWERANISPVYDRSGKINRFLAVKEDITLQKAQEERIMHQAHFDNLTDLPNRFLALDRLAQLTKEASRSGKQVAVLFLDLDDFKKVNDSLGHEVGDKLLVQAADRLRDAVREEDTVGRLGGDEFIVLLGNLDDVSHAGAVAENLLNRFRDPFVLDQREIVLTASVGISIFPEDGKRSPELLRNADTAMYHSKEEGRNTYHYFTEEMNQGVSRRLLLEEQLRGALDRGEFNLSYQTQIDIASGRISGVEALLRWENPALGKVSPAEFIPIAEQTGLIVPIGQYVLREALARAADWNELPDHEIKVAVNLSPRQFRDPNLMLFLEGELVSSGVEPRLLELEITEGVLLSGDESVHQLLGEINRMGITIAMDDFGTGYSSMSYLRSYPFHTLKIDRSFVSDITDDEADQELVNATIAMAHGLGLQVVAEGVETPEQLEHLAKQGCDFAQGYLFSKPMLAEDLTLVLQGKMN